MINICSLTVLFLVHFDAETVRALLEEAGINSCIEETLLVVDACESLRMYA